MQLSTSERVCVARTRAGVSQAELARECGISLRTYTEREMGRGEGWRLTELEAIAKRLGMPITELVG